MLTHIFEHSGVLLHVEYSRNASDETHFHSVRVMDPQYRPTGPELIPLLHQSLLLDTEPVMGMRVDAKTFLSAIAEDLP